MEANKIEILLEKYFEGETSIAEEKLLGAYFLNGEVEPSLEKYAPLFQLYAQERDIIIDAQERDVLIDAELIAPNTGIDRSAILKVNKTPGIFYLNPVFLKAAIVILLISVGATVWMKYSILPKDAGIIASNTRKAKVITFDENDDPQQAYLKIRSALLRVSGEMKKGTEPVQDGMEKMSAATRLIEQ